MLTTYTHVHTSLYIYTYQNLQQTEYEFCLTTPTQTHYYVNSFRLLHCLLKHFTS